MMNNYIFDLFFKEIGFDAGIVSIYDDMLKNFKRKISEYEVENIKIFKDVLIRKSILSIYDTISRLETYKCSFISNNIELFSVPIPVGSEYGNTDKDYIKGCFIIEGKAKVLVSQERISTSMIFIKITDNKYISEFKFLDKEENYFNTEIIIDDFNITLNTNKISYILNKKYGVNIFLVYDCFDINLEEAEEKIYSRSKYDKYIKGFLLSTKYNYYNYNKNTMYQDIFDMEKVDVQEIIIKDIFPHLDKYKKIDMITTMIYKCIKAKIYKENGDNRDSLLFKRVDTPSDIIYYTINKIWKAFIYKIKENYSDIDREIIKLRTIENILITNFKTGVWKTGYRLSINGVTQNMSLKSKIDGLSHVRRISTPVDKNTVNTDIRQIQASQIGYLCICETPEGKDVGITKYLSSSCIISSEVDPLFISEMIKNLKISIGAGSIPVYLNGIIIAFTNNFGLIDKIRDFRRKNFQLRFMSIYRSDDDEIHIFSDRGRYMRPLIINNQQYKEYKDFYSFVINGLVEYVDVYEQTNLYISYNKNINRKHTHSEIHPSLVFGLSASLTPFANYNQSPRIVFQASMTKQSLALSYDTLKYNIPESKILCYGQKPICFTNIGKLIELDQEPNGTNVIVSILSYTGYNQEDAIIFNKSSIDNGLFSNIRYDIIEIVEHKYLKEKFIKTIYDKKYDDQGIIKEGEEIKERDIIASKFCDMYQEGNIEHIRNKFKQKKIVDKIQKIRDSNDNLIVRIYLRNYHIPIIGDKFTSRYSQKGVIGRIMIREDLPFTEEGIIPDIIINPHAIPSRMTIGQLLEMSLSKIYTKNGERLDATAFNTFENIDDITDKDIMYCGTTGEIINSYIFTGICYYSALKHQVHEKIHSRSEGPIQQISRQPVEGKSKNGGLRFGEMEKDCLISHGATSLILEKLKDDSDPVDIYVCNSCGNIFIQNKKCLLCNCDNIRTENIPYSFKLLIQELIIANIKLTLLI